MKKCHKCNGTSTIIKNGEEYECDACEYGVVFEGYEQHWNPLTKSERAREFLGQVLTREEAIKDYPELSREMKFDGGF